MEGDQGNKTQDDPIDDSKPTEPHDEDNQDDKKSKSSTSDTGSFNENIADPFALLEIRDRIVAANKNVDNVDLKLASLDTKLD